MTNEQIERQIELARQVAEACRAFIAAIAEAIKPLVAALTEVVRACWTSLSPRKRATLRRLVQWRPVYGRHRAALHIRSTS